LRREAIDRANKIELGAPSDDQFASLIDAWFAWQEKLPANSEYKRADSTLKENRREAVSLRKAFGLMRSEEIEKGDGYAYLDACLVAVDEKGNPRRRPEKGNKEISLATTIFEYGVRTRAVKVNPFAGIEKLRTKKHDRAVSADELSLAVEVGRRRGGPQHICALALLTAYLCLRRRMVRQVYDRRRVRVAKPAEGRCVALIFQKFVFLEYERQAQTKTGTAKCLFRMGKVGGVDGARTRDPRRDRPVF